MDESQNDAFVRGSLLFDAGAFFEAHEVWEAQWRIEADPVHQRFFQGLIQVAAGLHKLFVMGAVDSASRLLAKGIAKLDACPAPTADAQLGAFRDAIRAWSNDLAMRRLGRSTIPKIGASRP